MRKSAYVFNTKPQKGRFWGRLGFTVFLLAVVFGSAYMYNQTISSELILQTEKVSVMGLDKTYEGFSVLHISDLQANAVGSDAQKWNKLLLQKNWDCVVCTGDMVGKTGNAEPFLSLIHTLQYLRPTVPIFFIEGDADPTAVQTKPHGSSEVLADWIISAQKLGAVYLDRPREMPQGKYKVWITPQYLYDVDTSGMIDTLTRQITELESEGKQYEAEGGALYRSLVYRLEVMQATAEASKQMKQQDLQIAVNHAPLSEDYIRTQIEWSDRADVFRFRAISLLLCGHYCGGGWKLPSGTPIYVNNKGFFPNVEEIQGMQRVNSINQYISPGIGEPSDSPFQSRWFNKATVTLMKFTSSIS